MSSIFTLWMQLNTQQLPNIPGRYCTLLLLVLNATENYRYTCVSLYFLVPVLKAIVWNLPIYLCLTVFSCTCAQGYWLKLADIPGSNCIFLWLVLLAIDWNLPIYLGLTVFSCTCAQAIDWNLPIYLGLTVFSFSCQWLSETCRYT
jgi:hypothetical protein